jgi:hypothetical protein
VISREQRIVICLMMWVMTALITARVEALEVDDIKGALVPPAMLPFAQTVASTRGLEEIKRLVNTGLDDDGFAQRLGFIAKDEILAVPGPQLNNNPFAVIRVDLKRLQNFALGQDPLTLLLDESNWFHKSNPTSKYFPVRLLFPITVDGKAKSSVLLRFSLNSLKWDAQQLGSPQLIKRLTTCGNGIGSCTGDTYFVVWIPALNRYFLGSIKSGPFMITPLSTEPPIFTAGSAVVAQTVFEWLRDKEAINISLDPNTPPR